MIRNLSLLLILFSTYVYPQGIVKGKIIDSKTKEPLAFANITFDNNPLLRTSSDIEGNFLYHSEKKVIRLTCSYVGYQNHTVLIASQQPLIIELDSSQTPLNELVITNGENPANRIIKKVIQNKWQNNPENLKSFQYNSYNKTVYDFKFKDSVDNSLTAVKKKLKGGHLFMMESVTERKFVSPDISNEVVIATKVSGFKSPSFASLATDLQPFSFYKDHIKLFNVAYLNPISKGSLNKYKFKIEDTLHQNKDTVYVISFKPLKSKKFDGLEGLLYINTNKYAIQNVIASPFVKGKITLKIQQQYMLIDNEHWFPEQLNYTLSFPEYPSNKTNMFVEGKSFIRNVALNLPLEKKNFSFQTVRIDENATQKDSIYWNHFREGKLNTTEKTTYHVIDSIGKKNKFDFYLTFFEKISLNKFPTTYFDIDISKTFVCNKFEGFRLGTGIYTNEKTFKNFVIGGFIGYGTKDRQWKYGGEFLYTVSKKDDFFIGLKHQKNLIETGSYGLNLQSQNLFTLRNYIGYQFDMITENSLKIGKRSFKYLKWDIALQQMHVVPQYTYTFKNDGYDYENYNNTSLAVHLKFAFKEKIISTFNQNFSIGTEYPIVRVAYSKGLKNLFNSYFNYNKIEGEVEQSLYFKNLGNTKYRLTAGYIDTQLPYGLLFTGEGSYDTNTPFLMKNNFQTMLPYEFLSDCYLNLFVSHNFGGLLFKVANFQPNITAHHNMGYGNLRNNTNHLLLPFKTKDKLFVESGIQVDNLLKINYLNLGYLGIGSGIFYRYGAYSNPNLKDNIAAKLSITFSIK
ncbi:DUF5686 family protein [Flavobacterium suncheonense]|uniref:DUF5686 family protein n=1 Tax=Flavobacterium suncheonense TaxID=350894 RepID=UPI003FA3B80C